MNKTKILFGIILLITLSNLFGQIKIHKTLSTENGLVSNTIFSMFEDSKGFLWIGTDNGVSRWDGTSFKNYYTIDGLGGAQVFDIKEGPDGTIYFATYGKGVTCIKNDSLYLLNESNGLISNWVTKILVRLNGEILFSAENGHISVLRNKKITSWKDEIGFGDDSVWFIHESKDSALYLGSYKLFKYKNEILTEYPHEDSFNKVRSLQTIYAINQDLEGTIFIGTLKGIYILTNDGLERMLIDGKSNKISSISIFTTKDGTTYFCGEEGVLIKKGSHFTKITKRNGLSDNNIWSILEDSNGILYFGTRDQGINIYRPGIIENYVSDKLLGEKITAINKDNMSNLYIGTSNGLFVNKSNSNKVNTVLSNVGVNAISIDNQNHIYVGTDLGLKVISNSQIVKFSPFRDGSGLNKVRVLYASSNDLIYIGFQGGLYTLKGMHLEKLTSVKGHDQFITDVLLNKNNSLIVGTHGNGISVSSVNYSREFNVDTGLSDNVINCIYETSNNLLLVGTDQGGLNVIQNSILLRTITINDGLTSNTIMDINEDSFNQIYLSTNKGINILTNLLDSLFVRTILNDDGLISNYCNRNATFIDSDGKFYFGTNNGISIYNPKADKPLSSPPKVYLTEIEIFNKKYPLQDLLSNRNLDYSQNYIKFFFTGLELAAPEKIIYKYRLNGVDNNWVSSKAKSVQYTSLDDGDYTFEVKARNEWGYWSEPTTLSFTINPAWWETWWFRLLFISFISGLLWLAFQYRLNYLLKLERLRTKIASDLHDEVGSLLTQISVNADSLSYLKDSDKIKEKSRFIRSKSGEIINMMSDVIWSIDSRNDNLDSLVDRIHNFAQNFLEQKNIRLNFSTNIKNLQKQLKIDFRQNIMLISKEAINNAVKYSNCSQIDVLINYNNEIFEMIISDNGKGFDFENIKKGNGLKNMKMRSESIGAKIEFDNSNGFKIILTKTKL